MYISLTGKRALSLRSLILNGCEHVTDVGINWLAEGCHSIEVLDLCGCTRLTDAGLRSLGEHCHSLRSLDLSHAKLISDVGIAQIAFGCPELRKLKCHGLFYLSDPRLAAPKKGEKAEPWQTTIGIAAIAENAIKLEEADLSGCFRLNLVLQKYVSSLRFLKVVNLMGCNQTTTEALVALAKGCKALEDLTLTDCGKSVNATSMEAFGTYCKNIKTLVLSRCLSLDGKAIAGVAMCEKLEKLDLSGCTTLTDLRLLPITEIENVVQLRHLNIINNPKLTDSTVSWVANGCPELIIFAFRGTSISRQAARAVQDKFPYCDMIYNDNFAGFWPKTRIDDRKLLNNYFYMSRGIIAIQARARKLVARKRIIEMAIQRKRLSASFLILSCIRIVIAKKILREKRNSYRKRQRQAILITSIFRIAVAKKKVKRILEYRWFLFKTSNVLAIQRAYRLHLLWLQRLNEARLYFNYLRTRYNAASKIQSIVRMRYKGKKVVQRKWELIYATRALHERKAAFIQRCYRGYKARKRVRVLFNQRNFARKMLDIAVSRIQKNFRVYRTKCIVYFGTKRRFHVLTSTIKIQKLIRGHLARVNVAEIKADISEIKRNAAALKIQIKWKVVSSKLDLTKLHNEFKLLETRKASAQIVFAKHWRRKLAYRLLLQRRKGKIEMLHRKIELRIFCATKIQALYRGNVGRLYYDEKRREKKGKWKELFDEEKQRRFFYNKLTGEIRWRMPKDLLDLMPKAHCDNCNYYEATVECAVCNEIYCRECWDQVHYGGRRRDHEFRVLYDFYGKRIDYGDGVFPCKWPTEIIQDEIQGWMLRVAPIRDPRARYGDWEEYEDEPGVQEGAQLLKQRGDKGFSDGESKKFFFNRRTFEATYDIPPDVTRALEVAYQRQATPYDYSPQYTGYYDASGTWINEYGTQEFDSSGNWEGTGEIYNDQPLVTAWEEESSRVLGQSYNLSKTPTVSKRSTSSQQKKKTVNAPSKTAPTKTRGRTSSM